MKQLVFLITLVFFVGCFSASSEGSFESNVTSQACENNISFATSKSLVYENNLTVGSTTQYFFDFFENENTYNQVHGGKLNDGDNNTTYSFSIAESGLITLSNGYVATINFWCDGDVTKYYLLKDGVKSTMEQNTVTNK